MWKQYSTLSMELHGRSESVEANHTQGLIHHPQVVKVNSGLSGEIERSILAVQRLEDALMSLPVPPRWVCRILRDSLSSSVP
jgi:hypothetical protein